MAVGSRATWIEAWEADLTPSPAALRSAARVEARMRATRYYGSEAVARMPRPVASADAPVAPPQLRVVTRRRPRWGLLAFTVVLAVLALAGAVVCPMLLSAVVTDVESQGARAERQRQELAAEVAALSAKISALSAPDRLSEVAAQLGLGPAQTVRYLTSDGLPAEKQPVAGQGETVIAGR